MTRWVIMLLLSGLAQACGGGGGGEGSSGEENTANSAADSATESAAESATESSSQPAGTAQPPSPPPTDSRMTDLVAAPALEFVSHQYVTVRLDSRLPAGEPYFLNVCSDFVLDDTGYQVERTSCLLRTRVEPGVKEYELMISQADEALLAEVWPVQAGAQPRYFRWTVNAQPWLLELNW